MTRTPALPTRRLTDPAFVYTPAVATDIAARFRTVRAALARTERKQHAQLSLLGLDPCPLTTQPGAVVLQLRQPTRRKTATRRAA